MNRQVFIPYDLGNSEEGLHVHAGQEPVSIEEIDPATYDAEDVGPMFRLTFEDGFTCEAFGDELEEREQ